jgi:PKD repeat protein
VTATEGAAQSNVQVATFTDSYDNAATDFTATINWGDSTSISTGSLTRTSAGHYTVTGSHTYTDEGSYTVSVTISDNGPGTATASSTSTAMVADADVLSQDATQPTIAAQIEGASPGSVALAKFDDSFTSAPASDFTASIDWGDTSSSAGSVSGSAGGPFTVSGSHTYADEGTYTVKVTLTDDNTGNSFTIRRSVTVNDASLTDTSSAANPNATEGASTGSLTVATFTDANPGDNHADFTATIHWGDGNIDSGVAVTYSGGTYSVSGSHTYADENSSGYVVTVDVTDDGGSTLRGIGKTTVKVNDATLTDTSSAANPSATEGASTATLTVATFTDVNPGDNHADFTAVIHWGDGNSDTGVAVTYSGGTYSVSGSHTYVDEGSYNVTVDVTDDGGSKLTGIGKTTVSVADAQLTNLASANLPSTGQEGVGLAAITGIATFTDPTGVGVEPIGDFSATINWGDASTSTGSVVSLGSGNYRVDAPAHTYVQEGTYTVNVTLKHDALASVTTPNQSIVVSDVTPSVAAANSAVSAQAYQTLTNNGTFSDYDDAVTITASQGTVTQTSGNSGTWNWSQSGLPQGTYTVTITATNADESKSTTSFTAKVSISAGSVYLLNPTASGAVTATGNGNINLPGALVVASNSASAIQANGNAQVSAAGGIFVMGTISKTGNAVVGAKTGSPASTNDPLASLAPPILTGLSNWGATSVAGNGPATLNPGIYTSIQISGKAVVTMNPGWYIVLGGGLSVTGSASVTGNGVFIFNAGSKYTNDGIHTPTDGGNFGGITLSGGGNFNLTPASTGQYAGILIYQSRVNTRALNISGNASVSISGIIYAANAMLSMGGNGNLIDTLVVNTLNVSGNVSLRETAAGSDGAGDMVGIADTLLAGNLNVYVDNSSGYFTSDELASIQDAVIISTLCWSPTTSASRSSPTVRPPISCSTPTQPVRAAI